MSTLNPNDKREELRSASRRELFSMLKVYELPVTRMLAANGSLKDMETEEVRMHIAQDMEYEGYIT